MFDVRSGRFEVAEVGQFFSESNSFVKFGIRRFVLAPFERTAHEFSSSRCRYVQTKPCRRQLRSTIQKAKHIVEETIIGKYGVFVRASYCPWLCPHMWDRARAQIGPGHICPGLGHNWFSETLFLVNVVCFSQEFILRLLNRLKAQVGPGAGNLGSGPAK